MASTGPAALHIWKAWIGKSMSSKFEAMEDRAGNRTSSPCHSSAFIGSSRRASSPSALGETKVRKRASVRSYDERTRKITASTGATSTTRPTHALHANSSQKHPRHYEINLREVRYAWQRPVFRKDRQAREDAKSREQIDSSAPVRLLRMQQTLRGISEPILIKASQH